MEVSTVLVLLCWKGERASLGEGGTASPSQGRCAALFDAGTARLFFAREIAALGAVAPVVAV